MNQITVKSSAWKKFSPLINIPYDAQLKMKEIRVLNVLKNLGSVLRKSNSLSVEMYETQGSKKRVLCPVESIQGSPIIDGYRNKISASVGLDPEGNLIVGHTFSMKHDKKAIIDPEMFPQLHKKNNILIIKLFEQYIRKHSKDLLTKRKFPRYWENIQVRSNRKDESMIHIGFDGSQLSPDGISDIKNDLVDKFIPMLKNEHVDIRSLYFQLNRSVVSEDGKKLPTQLLWGDQYITETLCGKTFHIGPKSKFPTNVEVAEALYQTTRRIVKESSKFSLKNSLIIDLCCGNGAIGILLSDIVSKVIGVDILSSNSHSAEQNSLLNQIPNTEYICQDVEEFIPNFINSEAARLYENIIVVVNPNSFGLRTNLFSELRKCQALKTIIHISRDISNYSISNLHEICKIKESPAIDEPFKLLKAIPLDPFPHTTNVELVLQFMR